MREFIFNTNPNTQECRTIVATNHYTQSCPPASYYFSIEKDNKIIGIATFANPSRQGIKVPDCQHIVELSRFYLLTNIPNLGSYFLSKCLDYLKQNTDYEAVVTFSDTTEGHLGTLYRASNFVYLSETKRNYHYRNSAGLRMHKRQVWDRSRIAGRSESEQASFEGLVKEGEAPKHKFYYILIPEKNKHVIIYGLVDPITKQLRYIGKTFKGKGRYLEHLKESTLKATTHKTKWINSLKERNLVPEFIILEQVIEASKIDEAEMFWIEYYRSLGAILTNSDKGGKGSVGRYASEETRAKMAQQKQGIKRENFVTHNKKVNVLIDGVEHRACGKCEIVQTLDNFVFDKKKNKYQSSCKECRRLHTANYRAKQTKVYETTEARKIRYSNLAKKGGNALASNSEARSNISKKRSKAIVATNTTTGEITEFASALKAKECGFQNTNIGQAIKYNREYKNHTWKFKN